VSLFKDIAYDVMHWCRRSRSRSSSRDLERAKRERVRERRSKGLPPFKEEHLISKLLPCN